LKVRATPSQCTLGEDLALNKILSLSEKALIGKLFYIRMNKTQIEDWIRKLWKPLVGYCPRFNILSNHWLVFHFLSEEDLKLILEPPWLLGRGVLMLKRWYLGFMPSSEVFSHRKPWMLLPDFLIEYLSMDIFKGIANTIGKFIFFDTTSFRWTNKRTAWVLEEFEMDLGLPTTIDIAIGDRLLSQPINY